jgi:hypothetical protein
VENTDQALVVSWSRTRRRCTFLSSDQTGKQQGPGRTRRISRAER